ncbi:M12 family metallo-peptidase [Psychromonas ossibalaenae]|uniref:M12 family metallo-peptidase n=1 Tax=Psychromonas ossibalaenae TaxID=444922 RepID=UPI000378B041|nr:M12 family metallo-peptidase [Psychromonas ossibalaenae]
MKYKLNKIVLAVGLIPFALNAAASAADNDGIYLYQSELEKLELAELNSAASLTTETSYWTKKESNIDEDFPFSCTVINTKTPYLVTQQNSFESCIINNFDVEIINDRMNLDNLPKLGVIKQAAMDSMNLRGSRDLDETVIAEHVTSWFMPKNELAAASFKDMLLKGFVITLPSRGDVLIHNVRIYPDDSGFSVQAQVAGEEHSNVFLHFNGQYWNGSIYRGEEVFTVSAKTKSQLLLQLRQIPEIDEEEHDRLIEKELETIENDFDVNDNFSLDSNRSTEQTTIDVVVVYSDRYADSFNGEQDKIRAAIDTRIAEANVVYQNSNVHQKIVLLGHKEISLRDNVSSATEVNNSIEAQAVRDEYGADLVSFWTISGPTGNGNIYTGSSSRASNTARKSAIEGQLTFVHELGHNMGAMHDRPTYINQGYADYLDPSTYHHGKAFTDYRSIMSYANCSSGYTCTRVRHFTNPDVDYRGEPTGIAYDPNNLIHDRLNGPANNAR